jgi:protoheme IX farnesyltransferase
VANFESLSLESAAQAASRARSRGLSLVRDLVALTKPRITLLVLLTGAAGMVVAPGKVASSAMWLSLVGTALIVSSANALNMWWERDVDAKMARTKNRPLPAGRVTPETALVFGLALAAISAPMLFAVNETTGLLGLLALITYTAIYTPMKRHSWYALLVGAVPGAMPPLMGWTTVTGYIQTGGLLLFAVLFFWQVPHFGAISLFRRDDYARAGLRVVSVDRGERGARQIIFGYTLVLVASSLLVYAGHVAGRAYLLVAIASGAVFIAMAAQGLRSKPFENASAKKLFAYSIVYLVVLLSALLLNRTS